MEYGFNFSKTIWGWGTDNPRFIETGIILGITGRVPDIGNFRSYKDKEISEIINFIESELNSTATSDSRTITIVAPE